ncbi:flagellin [Pseudoalteromonas sp.]|uniref:flagellin N-terminal helical domain-containing protein n=1 Tax=Pseudoalteromonas sp. TaxID=53249 RepID=UPI0035635F3B
MKIQNQNFAFFNRTEEKSKTLLEQLASGKRVSSASDDAAALQIIDRLQAQQNGQNQAIRNAYDGISYTQVAEGALASVNESVSRIEQLSLQAANGALTDQDRSAIQEEISQLQTGITETYENTSFGGAKLFDGNDVTFQVGADANQTQRLNPGDNSVVSNVLSIDVSTQAGAQAAISVTQQARDDINSNRANLGGSQNAFEQNIRSLTNNAVNVAASQSRIQDADYANLVSQKTANDILSQASIALRGQANQSASQALGLL